jgi:hypothetical protein
VRVNFLPGPDAVVLVLTSANSSTKRQRTALLVQQPQRHWTDHGAEGADDHPVALEPATALVIFDRGACFDGQD